MTLKQTHKLYSMLVKVFDDLERDGICMSGDTLKAIGDLNKGRLAACQLASGDGLLFTFVRSEDTADVIRLTFKYA